jgi:hypothetical protein
MLTPALWPVSATLALGAGLTLEFREKRSKRRALQRTGV